MAKLQEARTVMLMGKIKRANRLSVPGSGEVLDECIVAASIAPSLDAPYVGTISLPVRSD